MLGLVLSCQQHSHSLVGALARYRYKWGVTVGKNEVVLITEGLIGHAILYQKRSKAEIISLHELKHCCFVGKNYCV